MKLRNVVLALSLFIGNFLYTGLCHQWRSTIVVVLPGKLTCTSKT